MSLTQKQKDMIREAATGGPRNWQRAMNVALIDPDDSPVTPAQDGPSRRSASNDENQDSPGCEHAAERGTSDNWGRGPELRPGAQAPVASSTTANPVEAAAAEEQAKASTGGGLGPARPEDYALSRQDWKRVDRALAEHARALELRGDRGEAHEVRQLQDLFFRGYETIIRDVGERP